MPGLKGGDYIFDRTSTIHGIQTHDLIRLVFASAGLYNLHHVYRYPAKESSKIKGIGFFVRKSVSWLRMSLPMSSLKSTRPTSVVTIS